MILALILLTSCFSRSAIMTRETFDSISLGTPISDVVAKAGEPYAIHSKGGGLEEYEYHERFAVDNQFVSEYHYFLKVSQGKVVSKRVTREKEPAYDLIYQEDPNYPYIPLK
ncbi:MAG: hypothetical protein HYX48_02150 [Chlamydiales bacterium]|nr:hypothetical protein [Chlamydiales bacterium]